MKEKIWHSMFNWVECATVFTTVQDPRPRPGRVGPPKRPSGEGKERMEEDEGRGEGMNGGTFL